MRLWLNQQTHIKSMGTKTATTSKLSHRMVLRRSETSGTSSPVAPSLSLGDDGHYLGDMVAANRVERMTSAEPVGVHDELRGVAAQAYVGRFGR
jgi:hypothetical protein